MIYIGIDIGNKGAIVFLNNNGEPYRHTGTKNGMDFHIFFDSFISEQKDKVFLCIEESITMGRDGHTNSWNNGFRYGENIMSLNILRQKYSNFDSIASFFGILIGSIIISFRDFWWLWLLLIGFLLSH